MSNQKSTTWIYVRRGLMAFSLLILVFFALLEIMPFVLTISNSFKCLPAVQQVPQSFIPLPPFGVSCETSEGVSRAASETTGQLSFNPTLEGYTAIFEFPFGLWFYNTILYAICVTLLRLLFDSLAGYALARLNFAGNRLVFFIMLGTMMIPGIVLVIPRFIILRQLAMINTLHGVIITLAADAFGIFMMKQFFESIPKEIEEAAMVDGASRLTIFWRIVLPMATPALTALTIFSFQGTWNNFMDILIINNGSPDLYNLPLGMALLRGQFGNTLIWNLFLAGAVMTTLPLAIVFFVFQRYFVEGISYSGLKG